MHLDDLDGKDKDRKDLAEFVKGAIVKRIENPPGREYMEVEGRLLPVAKGYEKREAPLKGLPLPERIEAGELEGVNSLSPFKRGAIIEPRNNKLHNEIVPKLTRRKRVLISSIMTHPLREMIERELLVMNPINEIALKYGVSADRLKYHKKKVLEPAILAARQLQSIEVRDKAQEMMSWLFGKVKETTELAFNAKGRDGEVRPDLDNANKSLMVGRQLARDQAELEGLVSTRGTSNVDNRTVNQTNQSLILMPKIGDKLPG